MEGFCLFLIFVRVLGLRKYACLAAAACCSLLGGWYHVGESAGDELEYFI